MDTQERDKLYFQGAEEFNATEFFEAHEVWEELWQDYQGDSRKFYQGLIQVAVCFHHFVNGNIRGARKLYGSSRKYLDPYRPLHLGIDLDKLFVEMEGCCREMLKAEGDFPEVEIDPELIPEIHIDPDHQRE